MGEDDAHLRLTPREATVEVLGTFDADQWLAAAEVTVALGDLLRLADEIDAWFTPE